MLSLSHKARQKHLFTANISTIVSIVPAIERYPALNNSGLPACKATGEVVENHHLEQVLSAVLATRSETPATVMARLEAIKLGLEHGSGK